MEKEQEKQEQNDDPLALSDAVTEDELNDFLGDDKEEGGEEEKKDGGTADDEHSLFNGPVSFEGGEKDSGSQDESKTEKEVVVEDKGVVDKEKGPIPYPRFQEVITEKNQLKARIEELEKLQKQEQSSASVKEEKPEPQTDKLPKLSQEALENLRVNYPDLYQQYREREMKESLMEEFEQRQIRKQAEAQKELGQKQRVSYYANSIEKQFPDIKNTESDWFKGTKTEFDKIRQEFDIVGQDIAAVHMGLALADARRNLAKAKEVARKEVMAEIQSKLKAKRSQALAGQSRTPASENPNRSNREDEWGGVPAFEKENRR